MRFTISPCTSQGDTVFLIYDEAGEVRYRVTRSKKPAGAVLLLTDSQELRPPKLSRGCFLLLSGTEFRRRRKNLSVTLRISGNGIPSNWFWAGSPGISGAIWWRGILT